MTKPKQHHQDLHTLEPEDINEIAVNKLSALLDRCSLHLTSSVTGISRTTLYKWLDPEVPLESMDHRIAGWFILQTETNPKVAMLMQRGPKTEKDK